MEEAFGGEGYKSACNLFYISKTIVAQMQARKLPIFDAHRAKEF